MTDFGFGHSIASPQPVDLKNFRLYRLKLKGPWAYYLLAIFNVVTVITSLFLNHRLMSRYEASVTTNEQWAARLLTYSQLSQAANAVNAPGNDVFESQEIFAERARLNWEYTGFQRILKSAQKDLQKNVSPQDRETLLNSLEGAQIEVAEIVQEANQIFSLLEGDQTEKASQRMASMDRAYAKAHTSLENLRQDVRRIQQKGLNQQKIEAQKLKKFEYIVVSAVLIMVASLTVYGHKLSKQIAAEAKNKERLISELQHNQQLKQLLDELHRTQSQMVHSEKMAALGQMVAGVAHEINNPLNFIHSNLEPIEQYCRDLIHLLTLYEQTYPNPPAAIQTAVEEADLAFLQDDLAKLLASMNIGTSRIREIVKSLRNFSRLDEEGHKPVDIHEGIDNSLMILQHRLKENGSRPAIEIIKGYETLPLVCCNAGQLNQVFMNLLTNAIDALEEASEGKSYAAMAANPSTIWIHTWRSGDNQVTITIADNGPGIPEAICAKLFDPFFTTKSVGKGTGLGLSISYQIVTEKHGGTLRCDCAPGEGAKFIVELPIAADARPSKG